MVQKTYEITVEAVTQRTVTVDASNIDEAEELGRNEVKGLVGAISTEVLEARKLSVDLPTRDDLFKWLNTCPDPNWDVVNEDEGHIRVLFCFYDEEIDDA